MWMEGSKIHVGIVLQLFTHKVLVKVDCVKITLIIIQNFQLIFCPGIELLFGLTMWYLSDVNTDFLRFHLFSLNKDVSFFQVVWSDWQLLFGFMIGSYCIPTDIAYWFTFNLLIDVPDKVGSCVKQIVWRAPEFVNIMNTPSLRFNQLELSLISTFSQFIHLDLQI